MRPTCSLTCALVLSGALSAQMTWIVDENNGPGTHFTDLPPAVFAASSGDLILVRPGLGYRGFSTSKGLSIVGQGSWVQPPSNYTIRIENLPANATFVLANTYRRRSPWRSE